jgi:hypothetical protein
MQLSMLGFTIKHQTTECQTIEHQTIERQILQRQMARDRLTEHRTRGNANIFITLVPTALCWFHLITLVLTVGDERTELLPLVRLG